MTVVPTGEPQRASDYARFAAGNPDFIALLTKHRAYRERELSKLSNLTQRQQRDRIRKLLRDPVLALIYAYDAVRCARQLGTATPTSIRELADRCNPFGRSNEPIQRLIAQKRGRARIVQNFGPLKRMHQCLVADLVAKLHPPRHEQFLFGGGMPKALAAIEAAFREGCTHAVEVDFIDFYGGLRLPGLAELLHPLPASVVEHVVWDHAIRRGPDDEYAVRPDEGHPSLSGLVGLSLGAATSPVVGEIIIRRLLDDAQSGKVVTYADNILVLGRDATEVLARAEHLREVASRLEAGPLRLRIKTPAGFRDPHDYVSFASQWGTAIRHRLNWLPDQRKQDEHRIADTTSLLTPEQITKAERKVVQWRRSFPMWRTGDRWMAERLAELSASRYYQSAQPENLAAAQQAVLLAFVMGGGEMGVEELLPEGSTAEHRRRRATLFNESMRLISQVGDARTNSPGLREQA